MQSPYIITPDALRALLSATEHNIELVDVRTIDKHQDYNIGGKHIPLEEMPDRLRELDPTKLVVTYCTSGNRSMRALEYLMSCGFAHVKSLDGGMTAWRATVLSTDSHGISQ